MPEIQILSIRVKEIRKSLGLTQATFAPKVGICEEELSLIERGKAKAVKLSTLQKIAAFTGFTVAELLSVESAAEKEPMLTGTRRNMTRYAPCENECSRSCSIILVTSFGLFGLPS